VEAQPVVTWPNGNGALVQHLGTGATIENGVAVRDIDNGPETVNVTAVGPAGPFAIEADAVIVATPSFVANRIVRARRDQTAGPAAGQSGGDYGAWAVANVHLRARPRARGKGLPPAWDKLFSDNPGRGRATKSTRISLRRWVSSTGSEPAGRT